MTDPRQQAEHFLRHETQFHLGMLPTEQSHPRTRGLAGTLRRDTAAGIRLLQGVDHDVAVLAGEVLHRPEYDRLVAALVDCWRRGGRVCFSGCGATGRLSIMLEAAWKHGWQRLAAQFPELGERCAAAGERVCCLMTGGDHALVRSVEGFEDYPSFGAYQVVEAGLGAGDVLVAISEGGETSSVIGSLQEALRRGATAFFVFNNPAAVLAAHIERSREVIENPAVTVLDLTTGPMGVAGSTRLQATTAELLVVGTALEQALVAWLPEVLPGNAWSALPPGWREPPAAAEDFAALLAVLTAPPAVAALTAWVETERALYAAGGRVTYFADECLLDIFTDTTERAPTFMLPPFRRVDDLASPPSWAFVKHPQRPTPEAWHRVLARAPRCLDWDAARYAALGGPATAQVTPPRLAEADLLAFQIGCEDDPSRSAAPDSLAAAILLAPELAAAGYGAWSAAWQRAAEPFTRRLAVVIGSATGTVDGAERVLHIPCPLPPTPLGIGRRLAVKLALNTVSTATMGCLGRLAGNWMAHVETTNKKLIDRGSRLVAELAEVDYETACYALHQTIAELNAIPTPSGERRSPVSETIRRLRPAALES